MSWDVFSVVLTNLADNVFGNYLILGLFLLVLLFTILLVLRINPLLSFVIISFVGVAMVESGFFGAVTWFRTVIYIILGMIWAFILWRLVE